MLTVVCIKWGNRYGPEYVNKLRAMVARNLSVPHCFVCLTDDPRGLNCHVLMLTEPLRGWWQKVTLFKADPYGLTGRLLFLDLDVVITGSLDALLDYGGGAVNGFVGVTDFCRPALYNSSVFLLNAGSHPEVWRDFNGTVMERMHGDQDWISSKIHGAPTWPRCWIRSYKFDYQEEKLTPGTRVVVFHGQPKPHECGGWVPELWR